MAGYNSYQALYTHIIYIIRLTCNRGDNHGGEEGAVPWELTGERKIPGGVGEARWDVKAWCYL